MRKRAFSLIEMLVAAAVIALLSAILFPVASYALSKAKAQPKDNVGMIAKAAIQYGSDYDDRIPIMVNGTWRNLKNVRDGNVTVYGNQRTDAWPLLTLPYVKNRELFVDPARGDKPGIWSGPALATDDPAFSAVKNTYRMQSRHPMYGVNHIFLSPLVIPASKMSDTTPTDFIEGESHTFTEADDPSGTVFYTASQHGFLPTTTTDVVGTLDSGLGFFSVTAPGMWKMQVDGSRYIAFWNGTECSGDWCGDRLPNVRGKQRSTQSAYMDPKSSGNNVAFLDGHVKFLKDTQMAAGTDYIRAVPRNFGSQEGRGGGAVITDKNRYLWNLNANYYGAY